MIKLVACIKRNPSLTREEFHEYWLKKHGPLFQKCAKAYKAVHYVQSHTMDSPLNQRLKDSRGYADEYDGIGEIWWQSEKEFMEAVNSPECQKFRKMLVEDEGRFIDFSASSGFFTTEHKFF